MTFKAVLVGAQLWVKSINRVGGLNGHRVDLVVYDDGGDPARHRTQLQEAVERRRVAAFLVNTDALTGQQDGKYLEEKRVPHVGTMSSIVWGYDSPMYFPQMSDGHGGWFSWLASFASQMVPAGKTKLGIVACAEVPACGEIPGYFSKRAKEVGFDYITTIKASLSQPDYTAECLSAARSGVNALLLILDQNSIRRFTSSCGRQGFRPTYLLLSATIEKLQKDNPELVGTAGVTNVFPWFQTGTPATDQFQAAIRAFGGDQSWTVGHAMGWAGGKLLERAAAALPEPPTSDAILEGLWSIRDDTLGGLTAPLTFVKNQPPSPSSCWFNLVLKNDGWTSPDNHELRCR